jgi:hypothetical protein
MYKLVAGATFAALFAGAGVAEAQVMVSARDVPPGQRPPAGMCRIWIDGVPPGRQPPVMDCATARARAPFNSRIIYGDQTPFPGQGRNARAGDCRYERDTRPSLGEIIFGRRAGDYDCRWDDRRQQTGAWYEVGRDVYGNRIYQRTVRMRDGSIALQRARRDRNGRMAVIETRYPDRRVLSGGLTDDEVWARSGRRSNIAGRQNDDRRGVAQARNNNGRGNQAQRGRGNGRGNGRGR